MADDRIDPSARGAGHAGTLVRAVFAILALISLVLGAALYLSAESLGLDESSARLIATAFVLVAILDAGVVAFWHRLFGRSA